MLDQHQQLLHHHQYHQEEFFQKIILQQQQEEHLQKKNLFEKCNVKNTKRNYAQKTVKVPEMGDSITEGTLLEWSKEIGDSIQEDEVVCQIETDKVTVEVRSPGAGVLQSRLSEENQTVNVGDDLFIFDEGAQGSEPSGAAEKNKKEEKVVEAEAATPKQENNKKKEEAAPKQQQQQQNKKEVGSIPSSSEAATTTTGKEVRGEKRVGMTRMRKRISTRLKDSQNTYAMLTTFNEVDMTNLMEFRKQFKDQFLEKHGVKLGFMSAFVKASAYALQDQPAVNAVIDGDTIVYRDYVDISVAVSTPKGLVVPVLRDCQDKSFADIESTIVELGKKAKDNKITVDDMKGGTFTISNGGVFGSMMGTPIINPPQSAILGMHAIKKRPYVVNDEIKIRPIMYLALTYDHRLVDGKEAVSFLVKIKELIEDPGRMLLE